MAYRRFSINQAQAETICSALRLAIWHLETLEDQTLSSVWRENEMRHLLITLENYKFYKE